MIDPMKMQEFSHALFTWSRADPHGFRTGGIPEGYTSIQLHHRPDPRGPEVQLTFKAALVDGEPVIEVQLPPAASAGAEHGEACVVALGVAAPNPREPDAICEGCGVTGTVGRAVRTDNDGNATETHRFCLTCWPEQSARYRARWEDEDRRSADDFFRGRRAAQGAGPGSWFEASTWHGTLDFVRLIERSMIALIPPTPSDLADIAAQIQQRAAEVEGEMPFEVESFIRRYTSPS